MAHLFPSFRMNLVKPRHEALLFRGARGLASDADEHAKTIASVQTDSRWNVKEKKELRSATRSVWVYG